MAKGRSEKVDLSDFIFEEAVKGAWEAEPESKKKGRKPPLNLSEHTPEEIAKRVLETPPRTEDEQ